MKTDAFAAELHRAEFHRAALDAAVAFELALHTEQPQGSDQGESEINLPGYTRVSVERSAAAWTIDGRAASNAALIRFPTITGGSASAKWLSVGIGGTIRRTMKLKRAVALRENQYIEFAPGEIIIEE